MQKCKSCQGILLPGANFCHKCGANVNEIIETEVPMDTVVVVSSTQTEIDFELVSSESIEKNPVETYLDTLSEPVAQFEEIQHNSTFKKEENKKKDPDLLDLTDFKALFFNALHQRVQDEHNHRQYSDFVELFYQKKFLETLTQRYDALIDEFLIIEKKMPLPELPKQKLLTNTIENLIDYFIYNYCRGLDDVYPAPVILRYADALPNQIKNAMFFYDFLQLQDENILLYKDFIAMPQEKLRNTFQSYLFTERDELVYFICDLSLTGSGKEGFAISNKRMYWRMPLGKSHSVSFDNLQTIRHEKEWLEINGLFFNINHGLNMKMLRMMKKIKLIFA